MAKPAKAAKGRSRIKRGPGKRMVDGKSFRLADEVRYIQRRAAEHDSRIVSIGQVVLFSSESGDAWMLEPSEYLAFAWRAMGTLSRFISKTPRPPSRWPGRVNTGLWDRRSSIPIETAGESSQCSVTQRESLLRSGQPARAGAALRSNF